MTTTEAGPPREPELETMELDPEPPRPTRRRRPAPRAHPFWRFVFPLMVVAAGVAVFFVWRAGTKAVLDSTDGTEVNVVTDPTAPGYVAFVEPTPTMLLTHVHDGELVGVSVLARTALDSGGTLVLVSADMVVEPTDDGADGENEAVLLGAAFAEGGTDAVARAVAGLFGFGFLEVLEVDTDVLRGWMRLVEPLPFTLLDDLTVADGDTLRVEYEAGDLELSGVDAAAIYGWRNPGEFDANRTQRQLELWTTWLDQIGRADDLLAATLPFDEGLSPYLRSLGVGSADLSILPLQPAIVSVDAPPLYVLDDAGEVWLEEKSAAMVPLPVGSTPGARPTVRLLDGTGNVALRDRMIPILVDAGAEITVIGNAADFERTDTIVAYHQPENEGAARALAGEIGATPVFHDDPDQPIELTVTLGSDQENS